MLRLAFVVSIAAGLAVAQPAIQPASSSTAAYPNYFISMGGGYTRNATPNAAEGWVSAALQVGTNSPYYSITTVDMTAQTSTIRTGFAKVFSYSGNFALMGRIDAGISTAMPVIGNFSGGAILLYDLKAISPRMAGVCLLSEIRVSAATGTTGSNPNQITPGFYFGIGRGF